MNLSPKQLTDISVENDEEVLARLKFIGHIQKEEKIDVRDVTRHPNNFLNKIYRTIVLAPGRLNALKFIKDVISRSFKIVDYQLCHRLIRESRGENRDENREENVMSGMRTDSGEAITVQNIILDIVKAKQGILNLKYTYSGDTKFGCDIDVLIENISSQLVQLQLKNPELFESKEN